MNEFIRLCYRLKKRREKENRSLDKIEIIFPSLAAKEEFDRWLTSGEPPKRLRLYPVPLETHPNPVNLMLTAGKLQAIPAPCCNSLKTPFPRRSKPH